MTSLDSAALDHLDHRVKPPGYPRDGVRIGIVHFGVGVFHRAHQAVYVDDLLAAGARDWGICGVGVLDNGGRLRDVLAAQDNLYTLLTVDPDGTEHARIVGSHAGYLHAPADPQAVLDRLADPDTKIVTLTVTEGGYGINDATGAFEPQDAAILADMAGARPPSSVFGYIVAALGIRRDAGTGPFTVLSCDNVQHNGDVTRNAVTSVARALDPELADWIEANVAFPNSMVDRITPATTDDVVSAAAGYGIDDGWPVRSESFTQWVIEDTFCAGRPAFDTVGAQLVADVAPYEKMKLRVLNASHQVMAYLGMLAGMTYAHEVAQDPLFARFLLDYMQLEAQPSLDPVPGIALDEYSAMLIQRFGSEAVKDTLARLAVDASDRIPKFLLPVVRHQLAKGGDFRRAALAVAAWSRYLETATDPVDRRLAELRAALAAEQESPGAFLDQPEVFGDLGGNAEFRAAFIDARDRLARDGARACVAASA